MKSKGYKGEEINVSFSNHFVQDLKLTWPTPNIVCQCFKQMLLKETGDTKQIWYLFRQLMFNQVRLIWKDKIQQYCLMVDHLQFCITLHLLTMDKPVLRTYAPLKNTMDRTVVTKLNAKLTFPFRKIQTDSRS